MKGRSNGTPVVRSPSMRATLRGIRLEAGLSVEELAQFAEVPADAIFWFESGDRPSQHLTDVYGGLARRKQ